MKSLSLSKWKGDFHFRRYVQLNIFLLVDYLSVCCVVVWSMDCFFIKKERLYQRAVL